MMPKSRWQDSKIGTNVHDVINSLLTTRGRKQYKISENIFYISASNNMVQTKSKAQKNKNNKTKPANLLKKEYLESYEELKKSIKENQKI